MKMQLSFIALIASLPFLTAGSCEQKKQEAECSPNTICTMMFASVNTSVKDNNGVLADLDESYSVRKSNGEILRYDQEGGAGEFKILDDSYQKDLANKTDTFQFVGKKNGHIVVDELFVIKADCCHVSKVSGKSEIILK
jgi:hypothetical protein